MRGDIGRQIPSSMRRRTTHAQRLEMKERYVNGESLDEIAKNYPVSRDTVHRALRDMGVEMRPRHRYKRTP